MQVSANAALTWGVAIAIAAVSFGASGGLALERTTWTEVGLVLCGAALVAGAPLTRAIAPPFYGGGGLFGRAAPPGSHAPHGSLGRRPAGPAAPPGPAAP